MNVKKDFIFQQKITNVQIVMKLLKIAQFAQLDLIK